MNPQNSPQPIGSAPPDDDKASAAAPSPRPQRSISPPVRPVNLISPTRDATVNVVRSQIDQIFDTDQPNEIAASQNRPMIQQTPVGAQTVPNVAPAAETMRETAANANPETAESMNSDRKTAEIGNNEITETENNKTIETETAKPAANTNNTPTMINPADAHQKYHSAWQQYYQKYYEKYYIGAVEQQNRAYNEQLAAVKNQSEQATGDNTMTKKQAMDEIRQDILSKIKRSAAKVRKSRHFIPAIAAVVVILLAVFIQYNGLIFASVGSFVSPGSTADQDVIIGTGSDQPVGPEARLVIPKINVNAPVIYGLTDLGEESSQTALQNGVIHYPIQGASAFPGQKGNTVVLGHSSSDFFKPGNYKFIFVQLNRLGAGDLFYLDYQSKRYTYRVRETKIINPNEVGTLAIGEDKPYATLITCDPPGSAARRLVIIADQIAPDPSSADSTQNDSDVEATVQGDIAGNPPTLFEQIFGGQ